MAVIGRVLLIPKGDYSGSTTYNMLDWVRYNGSAWVCTTDGTVGTVPAIGVTEWALLAQDGSVSGSIAWASITGKPFDNFDTDDFDTDANSNLIIKRGTFGSIIIGSDTLEATGDDEIELVAGTNITLSVDDTTTPSTITITASGGSSVGSLDDLSDVTLTTPTSGQILKYDGTEWINDTAPSGGGMLPYLYIDSEAGSTVTVTQPDSTTITPTAGGSGHWECELTGGYGTYTIHSVLSGQGDATATLAVDTVKEYHITDNHYSYTINVTAPSGATVRITDGDSETYTGTGTGTSQAYAVHQASTSYTITATLAMDGNTKTDSTSVTSDASTGGSTNVTLSIEFGTITVAVDADFVTAGSTITCVSGGTSCTSKVAASTLTFRVPTTGTWTISGEVSGTTYTVDATVSSLSTAVNVSLQTTITVTVDIYSAAVDTVSYTDVNGSQTATTDSDGVAENITITCLPNASITFTSSVAKDPDNLSNDYSKTITITSTTTSIYVMPTKALYWWGWVRSDLENINDTNGWTAYNYSYQPVTWNTNNVLLDNPIADGRCSGIGLHDATTATKISAIAERQTSDSSVLYLGFSTVKGLGSSTPNNGLTKFTNKTLNTISVDATSSTLSCYPVAYVYNTTNHGQYLSALWLD